MKAQEKVEKYKEKKGNKYIFILEILNFSLNNITY